MASKIICALTWSVSLVVVALAPTSVLAAPQLAFDSWNGDDLKADRVASDSPGSLVTIANQPHTVSSIAVRVDLNITGSLKFVIFTHANHEVVYISQPKMFPDDGMTWKQSDVFSVELPPGQYDVGAIASVGGKWQYDQSPAVIGDFSSIVSNPNFGNYAQPLASSHATADAAIRLFIENQICGDGIVNGSEACDDGNADNDDACLDTCVEASCGDGFAWVDVEDCDDANTDNTDSCLDTCLSASCGDGFVWAEVETCDDANDDNTDTCLDTCAAASCGDGFVGPGEACDDSNDIDEDACSNTCIAASCGDGVEQVEEDCDDGNMTDDDDCTNACTAPVCGDAIVQAGEQCDDGNAIGNDECTNACHSPMCGDGITQIDEACDDGNRVTSDECTNDCALPACGDGILQASEVCDDGNDIQDDDCTNMCTAPVCGDAIIQANEECDDGVNQGGCMPDCTLDLAGDAGDDETGGDGPATDDGGEACNCSSSSSADERRAGPWLIMFGLGLLGATRRRWRPA